MKKLLTLAVITLAACPVFAHPGHDHGTAIGGEQHHVLWFAAGLAAIAALGVWTYARYRSGR